METDEEESDHSARRTLAYITQLSIMSIQPANKVVKHLTNSYD